MTRSLLASILAAAVMMLIPCPVSGGTPPWMQLVATGPSARLYHEMVYDAGRDRVVLFGGENIDLLGDTWEWDGSSWIQRFVPSVVGGRKYHAMAYDSARQRTVLVGGQHSSAVLNETYEWDGNTWELRSTTGIGPRASHAIAYDAARERVVLFGRLLG